MKTKIISVFLVSIVILWVFFVFLKTGSAENKQIVPVQDLSNHPIYSNYKFSKAEGVINIGVQPLYFPTGLITETMTRDTVLSEALNRLGLGIRFYSFLKGDDVNFFLRQGDIEVGIGGDMPAITVAANLEVVIPILIQQGFTSIIANSHMLIKELRGKDIGYAFGSNAHYALLSTLESNGLSEDEVNLIPMEVIEMPDALHTGKIAAFSAWEPTATASLMKYPESVAIHRCLSSGYMYFQKTLLDKHSEAVYQIVASEIRAIQWMQCNKRNLLQASKWAIEASKSIAAKRIGLSAEQNADLAKNDILGLKSVPKIPQNDLKQNGPLHREFEFLKTLGKISSSINWDKIQDSFDPQIINEVLTNSKKYKLNEFIYDIE